jgi:hypothetical protein
MTDRGTARARAARGNGARSRGPRPPEDRTRSSRGALGRGLTALRRLVLGDEDATAFDGLLRARQERFAPRDALLASLVRRLAEADWRLRRATPAWLGILRSCRHESDDAADALGRATIRHRHGAGAFDSLTRYRSAAEREYHRLLGRLPERTGAGEKQKIAKRTQERIDFIGLLRKVRVVFTAMSAAMAAKPSRRDGASAAVPTTCRWSVTSSRSAPGRSLAEA